MPVRNGVPLRAYGTEASHTMRVTLQTAIRDLNAVDEDGGISLTWKEPLNGSKCIKHYEVEKISELDNGTRNTSNLYENFRNVIACHSYDFKVVARIINDMSGAPISKTFLVPSRGI